VEACGFRDRFEQFAQLDTVVIGISTDTLDAQTAFSQKEKLNHPLFADPDLKATRAFGVLSAPGTLAQRKTFVIDKQGLIRKIYENVTPATHPEEVLACVREKLRQGEG